MASHLLVLPSQAPAAKYSSHTVLTVTDYTTVKLTLPQVVSPCSRFLSGSQPLSET